MAYKPPKLIQINVRVTPDVQEKLWEHQEATNARSLNVIVNKAIEEYLTKWDAILTYRGSNTK